MPFAYHPLPQMLHQLRNYILVVKNLTVPVSICLVRRLLSRAQVLGEHVDQGRLLGKAHDVIFRFEGGNFRTKTVL